MRGNIARLTRNNLNDKKLENISLYFQYIYKYKSEKIKRKFKMSSSYTALKFLYIKQK